MTSASIPRPQPLAPVSSFQQLTTVKFCNSFLLITIQIAPGWVYLYRLPTSSLTLSRSPRILYLRSPNRAQPDFEFRISSLDSFSVRPERSKGGLALPRISSFAFRASTTSRLALVLNQF